MNELIDRVKWEIFRLPIYDNYKSYYYNYLENVRAANISDREKMRKILLLLDAVKVRHEEHWYKSPLAIIGGGIVETLKDIGNIVGEAADIPRKILDPTNLVFILLAVAVVGIAATFLIKAWAGAK